MTFAKTRVITRVIGNGGELLGGYKVDWTLIEFSSDCFSRMFWSFLNAMKGSFGFRCIVLMASIR